MSLRKTCFRSSCFRCFVVKYNYSAENILSLTQCTLLMFKYPFIDCSIEFRTLFVGTTQTQRMKRAQFIFIIILQSLVHYIHIRSLAGCILYSWSIFEHIILRKRLFSTDSTIFFFWEILFKKHKHKSLIPVTSRAELCI